MNDPDFIEFIAAYNDQKEIYYRSIGMFELAQWWQWAADRTRLRQPTLATRGSGGSSLAVYESDGWLDCQSDMTPEQVLAAGEHLIKEARRVLGPDASEEAADYIAALSQSAKILHDMISRLKPAIQMDKGP